MTDATTVLLTVISVCAIMSALWLIGMALVIDKQMEASRVTLHAMPTAGCC